MELKPCPFCGEPVKLRRWGGVDDVTTRLLIACPTCGYDLELDTEAPYRVSRGTRQERKIHADEVWNRRK